MWARSLYSHVPAAVGFLVTPSSAGRCLALFSTQHESWTVASSMQTWRPCHQLRHLSWGWVTVCCWRFSSINQSPPLHRHRMQHILPLSSHFLSQWNVSAAQLQSCYSKPTIEFSLHSSANSMLYWFFPYCFQIYCADKWVVDRIFKVCIRI